MQKKISSALISVYYKDGLEHIVKLLSDLDIKIYSTGGTQEYIQKLGVSCIPVESLTSFPSILGGRVKTLHPSVFGGILGRRDDVVHVTEMKEYNIPEIDLVIVDLYPFEETVRNTANEKQIIEKIDIGGPSMLRAAAKNHSDVLVLASKRDYSLLAQILKDQNGMTTLEQRRVFAIKAFDVCTEYDTAISNYFSQTSFITPFNKEKKTLRYGENPHQPAAYYGNLNESFDQLHGKELSYNNLVDADAALQLIREFKDEKQAVFAIIKHTNVCGIAVRPTVKEAWNSSLAGDPESAFGGVLVSNQEVDAETASAINDLFFEVLMAPSFSQGTLEILKTKKNRILLVIKEPSENNFQSKSVLNGVLMQHNDDLNYTEWKEAGGVETDATLKRELTFANIVCKHLKSNAIALVKDMHLIGKGCGQTSRVDALRHAIDKAKQFDLNLDNAVLASDAFFPFDDCIKIAHEAGITAFIQPGGSIRDSDSIEYCKQNKLVMVITGTRHFRH